MRTFLRGKVTLLFLTLGLLLAIPAIAFADNVQNDVVAGGSDTIVAGGSTTINYRITANNGDGQTGCNAADASPATVTINAPANVTATPGSLSFTSCGTNKPVAFSSNTPGNYTITVSVADSGSTSTVGTYNTNPATFTLHVTNPPPPPNEPPTISVPGPQTVEATGPNGAVVNYTATASDPEDGTLTPTCTPASGSTFPLGTTTVNCSVTDSDGASDSGFFTVTVRETTAPVIAAHDDVTAEATGPNGADVSYTSPATTDAVDGNGTANCTPASGSTFALGDTTVNCTAEDAAGNQATSTSFTVTVRDTTGPVLSLPANITKTATSNSQVTVDFTATAHDLVDGSRPVSCTPASGSLFSAGTTTVNCSSSDSRGNTSNGSFTVKVNYGWTGFFQPIDNNPDQSGDRAQATVWNSAKAGQAIPIKFSLGGNQGLSILATKNDAGDPTSYPRSVKVTCPGATASVDAIETYSGSTAAGLHYDSTADQYIYNWKTASSLANTCQMLDLKLADGSHHYAFFKFTK